MNHDSISDYWDLVRQQFCLWVLKIDLFYPGLIFYMICVSIGLLVNDFEICFYVFINTF